MTTPFPFLNWIDHTKFLQRRVEDKIERWNALEKAVNGGPIEEQLYKLNESNAWEWENDWIPKWKHVELIQKNAPTSIWSWQLCLHKEWVTGAMHYQNNKKMHQDIQGQPRTMKCQCPNNLLAADKCVKIYVRSQQSRAGSGQIESFFEES